MSFTDSISYTGNVGASIFYTIAGIAQFILGLFWPPFARMGVNYFLSSSNLALVWANICSLIACVKYIYYFIYCRAKCKSDSVVKCNIGEYFPNEIFFPLLIPVLVIGVVLSYYLCIEFFVLLLYIYSSKTY